MKINKRGKSYKELIDYVVSLSSEEAEKVTPSIIKSFPNTYTFSKSIGERVVQAEKGSLPLCIIRPSIVTGAFKEPLQGLKKKIKISIRKWN